MNISFLHNQSCTPCQAGTPPLDHQIIERFLGELGNGWVLNDKGHLAKVFKFKNFMGAMSFANKVAEIAETEGHHPDLSISWGHCGVELWTHKIKGLSENDFIVAAKIEELFKG